MDDRTNPTRAARYEEDLYSWAVEQAALLRAGKITEADARNIAEELDDVGSRQYDKLEGALRLILRHLLKWDHEPAGRSRARYATIAIQRNLVRKVLRKSPGLNSLVDEAITDAYLDARIEASAEIGRHEETFPARCPYSWEQVTQRPIDWPSMH